MKYSVYHHARKFFFKCHSVFFGIIGNSVNTNENVTRNHIVFAVIERNNIGIIVMIQILAIDVEKVGIRTKNVIYIAKRFVLVGNEFFNVWLNIEFWEVKLVGVFKNTFITLHIEY